MTAAKDCIACGGQMDSLGREVEGGWPLFKCPGCGMECLSPQPDDDTLHQLYEKEYFKAWGMTGGEEPEFLRQMKKATFRRQLGMISAHLPKGHILDVGCATGLFMEAANEAGYQVSGLDISHFAAKIARGKFGEEAVFIGELTDLVGKGVRYDAINMSDYIEHVRDPEKVLGTAASLLKPGGLLLVQTPDAASTSARLMGSKWTHYKLEHLFYFTPAAIKAIAGKAGLATLQVEGAKKALNLAYIRHQFRTYRHPLLTPAANVLHAICIPSLRSKNWVLPAGELIALLQKPA